MSRLNLIRSVYTRTILLLTLAVLIVFSVLGLVYYGIVSLEAVRLQNVRLLNSAQAISEVVSENLNAAGEVTNREIASYVNFTARSTGALIWVINHKHEIILYSNLPGYVIEKLERSGPGQYIIDGKYLVTRRTGTTGINQSGDFNGLFAESGARWLSAVWPIASATGFYRGEVHVHYQQNPSSLASFLMTGSLVASFLAAFGIALIFIGILSRNITRPIRLLSHAAERVSRGDLSVRVELPGSRSGTDDAAGKLVADDLTVLVRTMNTMIEKLENQERERKDFISSVSHDLRTPITSIGGFVSGMIDGTIPADRFMHYLGIVKQEVARLQMLVNTMFEGNLMTNDRTLNMSVFDINQVIKEDVIGLEALLSEKQLGVQTDFAADETGRLLVLGDREAINRVVYNILVNAIRFTPVDGVVALTTRYLGKSKEIEVIIEDSGMGIPESEYPYIFDRFYKIDKSRTSSGSGLGLYISRTILAAHGQRITVGRSDLGGARFAFTLAIP
jgi:signal transduction histidine kinase